MPITKFLENNAAAYGDEVCLVEINPELKEKHMLTWKDYALVEVTPYEEHRRTITWGELDSMANRVANLLLSRGLARGEKVGILLMNCLEWLPIYFGILKAGGLAVPLNYRYTADEIKYCLDLADVEILIFGKEFIGRVESVFGDLKKVRNTFFVGEDAPSFAENLGELIASADDSRPDVKIEDEDFAAIYFSSGTTGFPKAILHRHKALMRAAITEQKHHSQTRDDVFLCIPPLYHTGAKMHWFGSLVSGSPAVLLKGVSPKWILQTVSEERVSIVWLLVPWAQDILDAIDSGELNLDDYDLSRWRLMHIGAQPVPPSLIQRWKKVFPAHEYDTNYGLSESIGPGCVHLGVENIHKVGAIGKAGYGWRTRIVGDDRRDVKRGDVGELAVAGDGVMVCYYRDEKATAEVLDGEWLYTGDMAREDEDGFIYLVDRKKDVIITGGENLYPVQIEDFIRSCEAVRDVAVIGFPSIRLGEVAAAIVELKPEYSDWTEEKIHEFCSALPRYKRPRVIILDKVPRNATGKIEKPKLREKYCGAEPLVEAQVTR